ncbi:hypothetical protein KXQ82_14630 [Mucilaginibacter sp. HMF5004]|uniref:hypothetical protein n=1 Tax=Mucilaginibacter rivuli TaxID=2857527 RepID=UPI001C5F61DD|nr:hypothetical protein [Mucilaginibacter rivuli]MBW4890960.1 hypothetical protein [Mucilaginibacter rivuli]
MKKIAFNAILSKLFLTMSGIVLTVLFIYFAQKFNEFVAEGLYMPIPYFISVVAVIWGYELPILDRQVYMETVNG